jgi:hypothetical protein
MTKRAAGSFPYTILSPLPFPIAIVVRLLPTGSPLSQGFAELTVLMVTNPDNLGGTSVSAMVGARVSSGGERLGDGIMGDQPHYFAFIDTCSFFLVGTGRITDTGDRCCSKLKKARTGKVVRCTTKNEEMK